MLADGRAVHTIRYQAELKRQGCTVALASVEPGDTVDFRFKRPSGISGLDYTLAGRELSGMIKKFKPDIVNPHYASGYGYIAALGDCGNVPIVMHCLGSDILIDPYKSIIQKVRSKFVLKKIPRVIVDSIFLGERARAISDVVSYKTVFWGADDEAFGVFDERMSGWSGYSHPLRILVPRPHKRIYNNPFIVESLQEPLRDGKIALAFPSWGDEIDDFKKLVGELCPGTKIDYYNYMSRDEYNRFMGQYDVYLSASQSDSSPASLIEAMASGLYPVVGDIPGVREWLDGENGVLYDLGNPDSLRDAFDKIRTGRLDVKATLIANNERAKAKGTFKNNIMETIEMFRRVIEDDRW